MQHSSKANKPQTHEATQPESAAEKGRASSSNPLWQALALRSGDVQAKLTVSQADDPQEREADEVAERVMRMASPNPSTVGAPLKVQRKCAPCEEEDEEKLHRASSTDQDSRASSPPPVVHEVLQEAGQPLDSATRNFFEPQFNQSFGEVRLHKDGRAADAARSINAYAFTLGQHVVLGAGQYAPHSRQYKGLLAHELTHVVQQGAAGAHAKRGTRVVQRQGPRTSTPPPTTGRARPATAAEKREFAQQALTYLSGQAEYFASQPDRDLGEILRHLRTTTTNALGLIEGDPAATTIADQLRTTYRDAVRSLLVRRTQARPGAVRTPPTLQELYEQNVDNILPFALPQASADTGAGELTAELEGALPARPTAAQRARHTAIQSARQRLRVLTSQVSVSVDPLFSTRGATMTVGPPPNTVVRFSSTIPAGLQRGLSNVAGTLAQGSLTPNTTVMIALDLTPFGGSFDSYRFTRLDLGATLGGEILVERQGAIGVESLRTDERRPMQERFTRLGFVRTGFSDAEFDQVLIGLSELPEAQLTALGALRFARASAHATNPDAAAQYNQATHTVTVFDRAYSAGMRRFGRAGRTLTFAAYSVVHEVGHAHDLTALRTSAAAVTAAERALLAEFGTGGRTFSVPDPRAPERARFNELRGALTTATAAERSARALSGARWNMADPNAVTDDLAAGARQPAFRQAALQDGGPAGRQMPTNYPNPDSVWQEYFAESFALYQTSPDLLRRMRPNVFRFMETTFPR